MPWRTEESLHPSQNRTFSKDLLGQQRYPWAKIVKHHTMKVSEAGH
jgi:hypothetical protein